MPKTITIIDPLITGDIKYSKETDPMITIIGFPPAGGWVTLNKIIRQTPRPTESGIIIYIGKGIKYKKNMPTDEVNKWPKKIFFGCAKGLSGYPKSSTMEDPKDAIKKTPNWVL